MTKSVYCAEAMPDFSSRPEMRQYLNEPKAMHVGAPGKSGFLNMTFEVDSRGRSVMSELHRRVPIVVQQELYFDEYMPDIPCVYILSSGGPNVDGDRYHQRITLRDGAMAHISTGAATKIAGMRHNYSAMAQEITLHDNAYLEFLPEPVIPCRHSRYITDTKLRVEATATLLYSEIYLSGRKHYDKGEQFEYDVLSVATEGERHDGTLLFGEKFIIRPESEIPTRLGVMAGRSVLANVILMTPLHIAERVYGKTKAMIGMSDDLSLGITRLPNEAGLQMKLIASDTQRVKRVIRHFCSRVRLEVKGIPLPDEFPWR